MSEERTTARYGRELNTLRGAIGDYWHGVTQNLSDIVLRTNPVQRDVERSKTARTLDPGPAA